MFRTCLLILCMANLSIAEELATPSRSIAVTTEKEFKVDQATGALLVSFEDLNLRKALSLDKLPDDVEKRLPERLAKLNDKNIRITGWMFPPNQETELPAFLFVEKNEIMHFGRRVQVGTLKIKSKFYKDELHWLYMIEDAAVLPK
jgi:hypothetical protein